METIPLALLAIVFVGAGAVTWGAGIVLTKTTDAIDHRFNIGDALGGLILLGVAGSLPEIAVVYSAAVHGHVPVIIGTLIGG
ncbi:MAG: sodium:calcium antiporter, partial [Verrucomicrobia bacterium]|nr:sodium:calcium antiporter [Verrucomicrobiota bacterium]